MVLKCTIMGLNDGYEQMKSTLLGMDLLLLVNRAYNLILQVEKNKQITGEINVGNEISALNVSRQVQSFGPLQHFNKEYKRKRQKKM